jgi:hypothetical protein
MAGILKFFLALIFLSLGSEANAAPYQYGELFFVEANKPEHSKLQILGGMITDNNFINSYGFLVNKSLFTSSLYRLSGEVTLRHTDLVDSVKKVSGNTSINQPSTSFHLVSSLLLIKAKTSMLNLWYNDMRVYLDLGLGATQYKRQTFKNYNPYSLYGGLTLEIPIGEYSFLAKYRRLSDNFTESQESNYSEIMLGMGFKW